MAKEQRIKDCRMFSPNWDICMASLHCIPLLPKLRGHFRRGSRKTVKAIAGGWTQGNSASQPQQDSYIYKLRAVVSRGTALCKPTLDQIPAERGGGTFLPMPNHGAITVDTTGRGGVGFFESFTPVSQPHSSGRPHIQEYMGSTNWIC